MSNKRNIRLFTSKGANLIDPNAGEENVPLEDLNISVELYVTRRERSHIGIDEDTNEIKIAEFKDGDAPFFKGTKINNKFSLTTDYTNVGSKDHKGLETLGITSIDIDFNTALMPLISMEMVDIRGRMHEMGNESPFNVFFSMPYPIFRLVIKGYYGKPVQYIMHLTDYNSSMSSENANFNIKTKFVGYTYAYLSDMLIGYLKAVPYTTEGKQLVEEKRSKDPSFLTFDELYEFSKVLNNDILKLKEDNVSVKGLALGYMRLGEIKRIRETITGTITRLDNANFQIINRTKDFLILKAPEPGVTNSDKNDIENLLKSISPQIKELNGEVRLFNEDLYKMKVDENFFEYVYVSFFIGPDGEVRDEYTGNISTIKENPDIFNRLANALKSSGQLNGRVQIVYLKNVLDDIDNGIDKLKQALKERKTEVTDLFFDEIEELQISDGNGGYKTFEFNIESYIKVLCDHVDILMESIKMVSDRAEKNSVRNRDLINGNGVFDIVKSDLIDKIYGFPDYKKKSADTSHVLEDTWIGVDHPNIDEVRFIEELYIGLINNKQKEDNYANYLDNASSQWYSINPLDTIHYTGRTSPWGTISESVGHDGEVLRMMILRAITFMGFTVKTPTAKEIKVMARLEANNAFINMSNPLAKDFIASYFNSDVNVIAEKVRRVIANENTTYKNKSFEANKGKILSTENGVDKYVYISEVHDESHVNIVDGEFTDNSHFVVPVTYENKGIKYDGDTIVGFDKSYGHGDRFISDYVNNDDTKKDDGATFIDILTTQEYSRIIDNETNYGPRIIGEEINNALTLTEADLTGGFRNILFNGSWNNNEFMSYDVNGENREFYTYFYEDETHSSQYLRPFFATPKKNEHFYEVENALSKNIKNNNLPDKWINYIKPTRDSYGQTIQGLLGSDKSLPYISFYSNPPTRLGYLQDEDKAYSLFGSEYYYEQKNILGKALLFLHSIPLKGMMGTANVTDAVTVETGGNVLQTIVNSVLPIPVASSGYIGVDVNESGYYDRGLLFNDDTNILNLFNQKAGFIQVPYAWVLLIGGILYRREVEEIIDFTNDSFALLPRNYNEYAFPSRNRYLKGNYGNHSYVDDTATSNYYKIDDTIKDLPESAKKQFRKEFVTWANDGFKVIQESCEIFNPGTTSTQRIDFWLDFKTKYENNAEQLYADSIINQKAFANYDTFTADYSSLSVGEANTLNGYTTLGEKRTYIKDKIIEPLQGNPYHFFLEMKDNSEGVINVINFLNTKRIIANTTYRAWDEKKSRDISLKSSDVDLYISTFITEFNKLKGDNNDAEKEAIFQMTNNDEIYLTMYKNIKSIKDKWITGNNLGLFKNLIKSFKFIDRGYNDIGKAFKLNPTQVSNMLITNFNVSLYSHLSRVLSENKFDFMALPNYIDYSSEKSVRSIFETYSYNTVDATTKPTFICMYSGERSNALDLGGKFDNDSFNFTENGDEIPGDFEQVPAFLVSFGDMNQSIFKSLDLNQAEFSETNESIQVTDQIASSYNNVNSIGQNIYNVYINRAYNSKISMLGNAMIQPFMYYQLQNVPMFRGAYVITKVSHSITPNTMTTNFTGNRVKRSRTQLLDRTTIFNNLIGNLTDIDLGDVTNIGLGDTIKKINDPKYVKSKGEDIYDKSNIVILTNSNNPEVYKSSYRAKGGFGNEGFNNESNTQKNGEYMTFGEIITEVSKITGVPELTLKTMSIMESGIGSAKTVKNMVPNGSGFLGHMQFGYGATETVTKMVNDAVFGGGIDVANFIFGAKVDNNNKTIIYPPLASKYNWTKDTNLNNNKTNSMYDDFINILAGAYLAKYNTGKLNVSKAHIADVYLSHQQGYYGLQQIKKKTLDPINGNARNNPPPYNRGVEINQDWYLAWAAHVEATAKTLDSNFNLIVGKDDVA